MNYKLPLRYENQKCNSIQALFHRFCEVVARKDADKIIKTIQYVETLQMIPQKYLKHIEGTKGLYEIRAKFASDIVRVFCFFDGEKLVILLSGFQKKTQKTPKKEIERAMKLMQEYFKEKERE